MFAPLVMPKFDAQVVRALTYPDGHRTGVFESRLRMPCAQTAVIGADPFFDLVDSQDITLGMVLSSCRALLGNELCWHTCFGAR